MRAIVLFVLAMLVFVPAATTAQTVEKVAITADAKVFRRPNTESEVRDTLREGAVVEVLERQEGWVAITTTGGVIGWVEAALTGPVPSATPTPAPPERQTERRAVPPPPPPPPARPPSSGAPTDGGSSDNARAGVPAGGGLYGSGSWTRLAFSATDGQHPGGELVIGRMLSDILEFRTELSARRRSEGALPGIDNLGAGTGPGDFATEEDPVWDFELAGALSVFVIQPSAAMPIGIHLGGFGDWTRYQGSITPSVGQFQTIGYGGEIGGFYRSQSGNVVRAAVQVGQIRYSGDSTNATESLLNFMVGIEPRLGPVGLAAHVGRHDGQRFMKAGFVFR